MRKPTKSTLRNSLLHSVPSKTGLNAEVCNIDGGALLHKVAWPSSSTYGTIVKEYLKFIKRKFSKYAKTCVAFDSYDEKYSTKNYEHTRRNVSKSPSIQVSEKVKVTSSREVFLQNRENKDQLIKLLSKCLIENDIIVRRGTAHADTVIVEIALNYSKYSKTVVFCDDTDILVILISCYRRILHDIYFNTERTVKRSKGKQS